MSTAAVSSLHVKNPVYALSVRDRAIIDTMVTVLRDILDHFARTQAHAILCPVFMLMLMLPGAANFFQMKQNLGSGLFASMLELAENMQRVPDELRLRAI